eukprot:1291292-Amphidinium_carterae.2
MLQPLLLKLGGQQLLVTRLIQCVIIEVEKPLPGRRFADSGPAVPLIMNKKHEWQLAVGKHCCKGICGEHSSRAKRFPLKCANRFSSWDQEIHFDEEEVYSATSDVEPSADNYLVLPGQTCSVGVVLNATSTAALEQVGTQRVRFPVYHKGDR